ncbi:MAG TPA: hypothetical protein VGF69_13920 [Thermoanaerobaculia bacterium]|jgi:uncharacterized protein HemX
MPEPVDDNESESHVERKVVYETRSASTTKQSAGAIIAIVVIALAIVIFIVMQMR